MYPSETRASMVNEHILPIFEKRTGKKLPPISNWDDANDKASKNILTAFGEYDKQKISLDDLNDIINVKEFYHT